MNRLRSLRGRDYRFESRPGHGCLICVRFFFYIYVVMCLGRGLATSLSPVQRVLPPVKDQETEQSALCSNIRVSSRVRGQEKEK
jgi:hypothetical protein